MARGMDGFAGADFGLALGHADGYRWWKLAAPQLTGSPARAGRDWPTAPLIGANDFMWQPGVNEAVCSTDPFHEPPVEYAGSKDVCLDGVTWQKAASECGCGFWAYWKPQEHPITGSSGTFLPVLGVVRGTGRTLIGPLGFRSQQARIIALHLPFQIVRTDPGGSPGGWHDAFTQPGVHHPPHGQPSRTGLLGSRFPANQPSMAEFDSWLRHGSDPAPAAEPETPDAHALAWMGVIEDRLATMYSASMFSTRAALLASHPPDTRYAGSPVPFPIP